MAIVTASPVEAVRRYAQPLAGDPADFEPLLDLVGDSRFVMLGEATHGSHEFYRMRADITRRLIREKGFQAVAVEADWPDAYRVNRYVYGRGPDRSPREALSDFQRFPLWMWRNTEVEEFVQWLKRFNELRAPRRRVGFYGLDMYSLYSSIAAVIEFLNSVDPQLAQAARHSYDCFDHAGDDAQHYGYRVGITGRASCEQEAVSELLALREQAWERLASGGWVLEDERFQAERNAALVVTAEAYYRGMFDSDVNTWNVRDQHMMETLEALDQHLSRRGGPAKIVVWEHNSHLGDARATQMGQRGEWNVGQLARERYGADAVLVGFTTYEGTVSAASQWDGEVERKRILPGLPGSVEALFHDSGEGDFFLNLRNEDVAASLAAPLLERAIGVLYLPHSERSSHYFRSHLPQQFDAVIHVDRTRALQPLELTRPWQQPQQLDETYPFGV